MADNPYQLDPFTRITNIQFGSGKYLLLFAGDVPFHPTPTFGTAQATLPTIEGGTPGFQLLDGTGAPFPKAVIVPISSPIVLTSKLITGLSISLAGQQFNGFAVSYKTALANFAPETSVYLPLIGILAKPFSVRMFAEAFGGDNMSVGVGVYDKNIIKPGAVLNGSSVVPSPTAFEDTVVVSGSTFTEDFKVDPVKLTVN